MFQCITIETMIADEIKHRENMKWSGNHEQIHNKLQYFIHTKKIPNLIFHGEPQSGKRTLLNEFLHNIYLGDRVKMKNHIMTVECCHGKGIKFIREELKRRCIELFSHNTRFFIVVENKERLLNPILSRFCEIYVSDGKINPTSESTTLSDMYGLNMYQEIIQSSPKQPHILVKYAIQWCEDGWCVYDWMNCLSCDAESNTPILSTERLELLYLIRMCYYKIKPDFRCEKMLMFYLLYFTLISSKEDLKNMLL